MREATSRAIVAGRWVAMGTVALAAVGCASPLGEPTADEILRARVKAAIDRELAELPPDPTLRETAQALGEAEAALTGRREELDAIGPQSATPVEDLPIGNDLTGAEQRQVSISLRAAIASSVEHNLAIQTARLQPAISEANVLAAEAAFDWVFSASANYTRTDQPSTSLVIAGNPIGVPINSNLLQRYETGVRKPLTSGGELFVSTDLSRFENRTPGLQFSPDPAYSSAVRVGLHQPLLRGFGTNVNTAVIRLNRNLERRSIEQLRLELLTLVADTEGAYWRLVQAWQDLIISEWLVQVGIKVRDVMDLRRDFDTRPAEFSDAVATVETRRADVIRARRALRTASDTLKVLINQPQLTVGSEALLLPVDWMVDAPIRYSLRQAIVTAVAHRPEIHQSILGISDATIRQELADDARLPILNLSAEMAYFGLDDSAGGAYSQLGEGGFIDWLASVVFEVPIGNRAAEAGFRRARLERSAAVIGYQRTVQLVIIDVKNALRDCVADYELILASRSSRIAQAENLRALTVEEENLAGLTPEFLNLKFQRQERLAQAKRQEIISLVDYNEAVAALYRAMGTGLEMNQIDFEVEPTDDPADAQGAPIQ